MIPEKDMRGALSEVLLRPQTSPPELDFPEGFLGKRIISDSREIQPGDTFAAFLGEGSSDGRDFIADAIAKGAHSVLWDEENFAWKNEWSIPNLPISNLKLLTGVIASQVYKNPSTDMWVVGTTGTNGKTSCTTWIAQAFESIGKHAAVIGTLGNGVVNNVIPGTHTTPSATHIQALLKEFADKDVKVISLETSSHGLLQGRVSGIDFDVALFTNLSRDHLDYHGDMVSYGAAKAKLFAMPGLKHAVINIDDLFGEALTEVLEETNLPVITYGMEHADLAGVDLNLSASGISMMVAWKEQKVLLESPLIGAFNAYNLLGVIGVLLASNVSLEKAVETASKLQAVPGRLQRFAGGNQPVAVVDYAHTPDALEKVLKTLRPIVAPHHRLICLFGCGGDRDRGKRPQMGAVAAELADLIIVTSDNPRSESPSDIIDDIIAGATTQNLIVIEDRKEAIRQAIAAAEPGDVVLLAGKGHETYQEIHGVRTPFSDIDIASSALAEKFQ